MTDKLNFTVEQGGYAFTRGDPNRRVQLDGGRPRVRRDILFPDHQVRCTWALFDTEYDLFMDFYHNTILEGSIPFLLDIPCNFRIPVQHKCLFTSPLTDSGVRGLMHYVSAELSVEQNEYVIQSGLGVRFVDNGSTNRILPVTTFDAAVTNLFTTGDTIQIIDGSYQEAALPPVNLNGIYVTNSVLTTEIGLASADSVSSDWAVLEAQYPSGTTAFLTDVKLIKVPT